ncbi:MAG: GIY-YIG nuclease family protein [Candidatus Tectomicrobia bacterium]|nr:GIY-YIG nuclease family protein [Candidatus Tectomicrobia bacterium]
MRIDLQEIAVGFGGALQDLGDILSALLAGMEPWVLVLICLFWGAWLVQLMDRLTRLALFGWLCWLRRLWLLGFSGWCVFPGCGRRIKARFQLCHNHFLAASRYQWEHRDGWGKKDRQANAFWVYLLVLDGGKSLYAGQTRNLMRRMQEHGEGTTKTTAGRRPVLAWFEQVPTRQAAVEREADLKHRIDTEPQAVRQMVAEFRKR